MKHNDGVITTNTHLNNTFILICYGMVLLKSSKQTHFVMGLFGIDAEELLAVSTILRALAFKEETRPWFDFLKEDWFGSLHQVAFSSAIISI